MKRTAILGRRGSFHEEAALAFYQDIPLDLQGFDSFERMLAAYDSADVDAVIIAVENTLSGGLVRNLELIHSGGYQVVGEVHIPVHQYLLALPGQSLESIKEVRSHEMALYQTRAYLKKNCPEATLTQTSSTVAAVQEIVHLNQKPANAFTGTMYETQKQTIIPDFTIEEREDELFVVLNTGDIPELHVSREYSDMLTEYGGTGKSKEVRQAASFIRHRINAAQMFIDAIKQRNETLMHTMTAILKKQYDFFLDGEDSSLKPMVLQDIADMTGYDVSTISRVSNSKYVETRYGIYPLKYFFSEAMTNAEGDEVSTREIKKILGELIAQEDKRQPLTDEQLVTLLTTEGYPIARRTVAKYRDQLNIPVARMRKQ